MSADQELRYKITTAAETKGAEDAARAIEGVGKAVETTAKDGERASQSLGSIGQQVGGVQNASRALGELARGNIRPLENLGGVIRGVGNALKANPLFLLGSIAGAVIVPAIGKIREGFEAAKKKAEESSKASNDALEDARKAISEKRRNETAERFREIADAATEAKRRIDLLAQAEIARNNADEAVAVARINADEKLTPLQRAEKLAETRKSFRDRNDAAEVRAIQDKLETDARALEESKAELPELARLEEIARRRQEELERRSPDAIRTELRTAKDRLPLVREASRNVFGSAENRARFAAEAQQLEDSIPGLEKELADALLNYAKNVANAAGETEKATAAKKAAEDRIAAAEKKKASDQEEAAIRIGTLEKRREAATTVEQIELQSKRREDLGEQQRRRVEINKRLAEIEEQALQAAQQGDWATQDRLAAEGRQLRGERSAMSASRNGPSDTTAADAAAQEAASKIAAEGAIDTKEATGGIITLGNTFVAVQGMNRQAFGQLDAAIKAASEQFRREMEAMRSQVENLRNANR